MSPRLLRHWNIARLAHECYRASTTENPATRSELLRRIASRMASLHGLPQKVGQLLSLRSNDTGHSFGEVTEMGEPVSLSEFQKWLSAALSKDACAAFCKLEEPGRAASIGQVHRAVLHGGDVVAVKVQYPHIRECLDSDLSLLGLIIAPLKGSGATVAYNLDDYRAELGRALREELDYAHELAALTRAHRRSSEINNLVVPRPYPELCSQTAITMEWLEGEPFANAARLSMVERELIGRTLLQFFLKSWLDWGELHCDPHFGNLVVLRDRVGVKIGMIDFGATYRLSDITTQTIRDVLYSALERTMTPVEIYRALVKLGFESSMLEPCIARLPAVLRAITHPFVHDTPLDLCLWRLGERLKDALGEDRWNFRLAAPPSLLHFIRALTGLVRQLTILDVPLNWYRELKSLRVGTSHHFLPVTPEQSATSEFLRISVTRRGEQKVQVTLPSHARTNLRALIPPSALEHITAQGLNLDNMIQQACDAEMNSGVLVDCELDETSVRIELIQASP